MKRSVFFEKMRSCQCWQLMIFFQLLPAISLANHSKDSIVLRINSLEGGKKLDAILQIVNSEDRNKIQNTRLFLLLDEAQLIADSLNDNSKLAETHQIKGIIHRRLGNYQEALNNYLTSLGFFEQVHDLKGIAHSLNNIGCIYEVREEYDKAIEYHSRALDLAIENEDKSAIALSLKNLGKCYELKKDLTSALIHYLRAVQFYEDIDERLGVANVLNNIAAIYKSKGYFNKALFYYNRSLETCLGYNDEENIAITYYMMGEVFREVEIFEKARDLYAKSLEIALRINLKPVIADVYRSLYLLHSGSGNYKDALNYFESHIFYKDSLFNEKSEKKIVELQAKYDFESKDKEIALLNIKKELQEAEIKEKKIISYSLGAVVILIFILLLLIYRQFHLKQKANKILALHNQSINKQNLELQDINKRLTDSENKLKQLNATKDKFFSIISHDLRSPLNSLSGLLQLIIRYSESLSKTELIEITTRLDKSVNNLSNLLTNLLQWAMAQMGTMEFKPEALNLYDLVKENVDLIKLQTEEKDLKVNVLVKSGLNIICDKNMLNFIIRNLLSNAVKFTNNGGEIKIEAYYKESNVFISIADSGIGIHEDNIEKLFKLDQHFSTEGTNKEAGTGLGLILCKDFLEKNGGTIEVESKLGSGTTFIVKLPGNKTEPVKSAKVIVSHL